MPRAKKADARPPRGAGINDDPHGEPRHGDDPAAPASKAVAKRSIQSLHSEAEDDNPTHATNDTRICRTSWPTDPEARRRELVKVLPQAIREYFGNEAVIEHRLSLEDGEVKALASEQPALAAAISRAQAVLCALAEDCLAVSVTEERNSADARYLLERLYPDKYARKSVADKGNGRDYALPKDDPKSVLDSKTKPLSEVQ